MAPYYTDLQVPIAGCANYFVLCITSLKRGYHLFGVALLWTLANYSVSDQFRFSVVANGSLPCSQVIQDFTGGPQSPQTRGY